MAIIKIRGSKCWKECREMGTLIIHWWERKICSTTKENNTEVPQKTIIRSTI